MEPHAIAFWSFDADRLLKELKTTAAGLTDIQAKEHLKIHGANRFQPKRKSDAFSLLIGQFKSPIILMLLFAAGLSIFLRDHTDAVIIVAIVLISGLLGFWQEKGAADAGRETPGHCAGQGDGDSRCPAAGCPDGRGGSR